MKGLVALFVLLAFVVLTGAQENMETTTDLKKNEEYNWKYVDSYSNEFKGMDQNENEKSTSKFSGSQSERFKEQHSKIGEDLAYGYMSMQFGPDNHESQRFKMDKNTIQNIRKEEKDDYEFKEDKVPVPDSYLVGIIKNVPVSFSAKYPVIYALSRLFPLYRPVPVPVPKYVPYPVPKIVRVPYKVPVKVPYPVMVKYPVWKPYPVIVVKKIPVYIRKPLYIRQRVPYIVHQDKSEYEDKSGLNIHRRRDRKSSYNYYH